MAKFDAGAQVERLEYDFTAYAGPKGMIPEPSTETINEYFNRTKTLMQGMQEIRNLTKDIDLDEMTEEQVNEVLAKLGEEDPGKLSAELMLKTKQNIAILCGGKAMEPPEGSPEGTLPVFSGGSPTYEEIEALPPRVFNAFQVWLVGEVTPKKAARATKR